MLVDILFGALPQFQTKSHVLIDRHVRVQRVVLKHHGNVAVFRRLVGDVFISDESLTGR